MNILYEVFIYNASELWSMFRICFDALKNIHRYCVLCIRTLLKRPSQMEGHDLMSSNTHIRFFASPILLALCLPSMNFHFVQ